jgi:(4S)-4-hydroxy-5-phosphonooxypentane-2,3-dione isomerase
MLGAILRFDVKPEHREAFLEAVVEHGRAAVPTEPGTLRFDVLVDQEDVNRIFLYEAYADAEAFSIHLAGESHQRLVRTLTEQDWLTTPLAGPPRPFAPFVVGRVGAAFTAEEAREHPA